METQENFTVVPIGRIRRLEQSNQLQINTPYRDGLKQLGKFSHVLVFWWADRHDNERSRNILVTRPPYAQDQEVGVFATRAEYRPNPIAVTLMSVISVDVKNGIVVLPWIDAFDGTPVLDIKPYIPISDRIREYKVAPWLQDWPEWMEDAAEYFAEHATDFGD